jgi:hypothetical protein
MPAFLAVVPGFFAGSMCFGLIVHWVTLLLTGLRRNPIDAPLPVTGRVWGRIFTVIHPVPWLVLIGIPYGIHSFLTHPPAAGWRWFFAGMAGSVAGSILMAIVVVKRNSTRSPAAVINSATRRDNVA